MFYPINDCYINENACTIFSRRGSLPPLRRRIRAGIWGFQFFHDFLAGIRDGDRTSTIFHRFFLRMRGRGKEG